MPRPLIAPSLAGLIWAVAIIVPGPASAVECWRGWGYWVDAETRAYKSGELLLVTRGAAVWEPGRPVALYFLDRASGRIVAERAPITLIPVNPRSYYRGNLNYVDGRGAVVGAADNLVFGLSHIAPPTAELDKLQEYNAWACGLEGTSE